MSTTLREGPVKWQLNLNAASGNTAFPTASTDGVSVPSGYQPGAANRIHAMLRHTVASGTVSLSASLFGYSNVGDFSTGGWSYVGSFNGGSSMAADTSRWSPDQSTIVVSEVFVVTAENFSRYALRVVCGGTTSTTTGYIGYPIR